MNCPPEENSELFDGFGNGSLHMCVVRTSEGKSADEGRYLEMDFHRSDWEAVFYGALDAHRWDTHVEGEGVDEHTERNRRKFHESIPEFPELRTIFDMYEDYVFEPENAVRLREECVLLRGRLNDEVAIKALRKLIYGCDKAIESGCSLLFSCD